MFSDMFFAWGFAAVAFGLFLLSLLTHDWFWLICAMVWAWNSWRMQQIAFSKEDGQIHEQV